MVKMSTSLLVRGARTVYLWGVYSPTRLLRVSSGGVCPYQPAEWRLGGPGGVQANGLRVHAVRRLRSKLRQSREEAKALSTHQSWVSSAGLWRWRVYGGLQNETSAY